MGERRTTIKKESSVKIDVILIVIMGFVCIVVMLAMLLVYWKITNPVAYNVIQDSIVECKVIKIEKISEELQDSIDKLNITIFDGELKKKENIELTRRKDIWVYLEYKQGDNIRINRKTLEKKKGQKSKQAVAAPNIKYSYSLLDKQKIEEEYIESKVEKLIDVEVTEVFYNNMTSPNKIRTTGFTVKYRDKELDKTYGEILGQGEKNKIQIGNTYKAVRTTYRLYDGQEVTEYKLVKFE